MLRSQLDVLPVRVENIVCIALGTLLSKEKLESEAAATQHLLACAISTYLSQWYATTSSASSTPPPIPIIARDPSYTFQDMVLLSHCRVPITVVSEPYQYLSITPSTLLLSLYQSTFVPVFQIAADMTFPTSPAAIICTEILNFSWHKEGRVGALDSWSPRVGRMLQGMDVTWLGREMEGDRAMLACDDEEGEEEEKEEEEGLSPSSLINAWGKNLMFYARRE